VSPNRITSLLRPRALMTSLAFFFSFLPLRTHYSKSAATPSLSLALVPRAHLDLCRAHVQQICVDFGQQKV